MADRQTQAASETSAGEGAGALSAGGTVLSFAESEFLSRLGERVRNARTRLDMSRRELARRSGISERYIAQIEGGRGNVSIVLLLRIAQVVRISDPLEHAALD